MSIAMTADDSHLQTQPRADGTIRLREDVPEAERNYAMAIHLTPFAGMLFGPLVLIPLVLWLVKKDDSRFNDDHGREMVNVLITGAIFTFVGGILIWTIIPIFALMAWYITIIIGMIRGSMAASRGEYFRYPMTIRFLS